MIIKLDWKRYFVLFLFTTSISILYWLKILNTKTFFWLFIPTLIFWILSSKNFLEKCYVIFKTLPRDLSAIKLFIKFRFNIYRFVKNNGNIVDVFKSQVKRNPDKTCFIAEDRQFTYKEVDEFSNRVANVFQNNGLVKGDVVALYMESIPEFICIWLGLAKIGVVTSLVNYNLKLNSLTYTITTANSKAIIFGANIGNAIEEIVNTLPEKMDFYYFGNEGDGRFTFAKSLNDAMARTTPEPPQQPKLNISDHLVYIYTSGTTGLPKAVIITNLRFYFISAATNSILRRDDIIYVPLPIYHSAGGILGASQAVCFSNTVVIRKKFSASQFWDDCIKYNCTISQYLGETCRYLLTQPSKPQDRQHSIRLMFGTGLKKQIWDSFVTRFGIKTVLEIYGSTEGNANIVNIDGKAGAVGFIPSFPGMSSLLPCALVKVDERTGVPLRDENGLCIQCKRGESGEFVGKIANNNPERQFDGYLNKEATSKKIYSNVFQKGDTAFASGDILVMDRFGYLYFKDRTGDTFRWKSENVSTVEVEGIITNLINLNDSVVYGVQIPNCEGRAGMAAILDPTNSLDLDKLYRGLANQLPAYSRPLFLRIAASLPLTGTFKLKKVDLQSDGFDPAKCGSDCLYYLNGTKYSLLTDEIYKDICDGKIELKVPIFADRHFCDSVEECRCQPKFKIDVKNEVIIDRKHSPDTFEALNPKEI